MEFTRLLLKLSTGFNEPGYETSRGQPSGNVQSQQYNETLRLYTLRYALLPGLRLDEKAYAPFAHVLREHYRRKKRHVLELAQRWAAECAATAAAAGGSGGGGGRGGGRPCGSSVLPRDMQAAADDVCAELRKLAGDGG